MADALPIKLDDLIAVVKEAEPDDALKQLEVAATIKGALDEQADALLGHFVDRARASGASWSDIGDALGVSKQAVQQKHGWFSRLKEKRPKFNRFTGRARAAVERAEAMATELNHNFVGTEHLLLGLIGDHDALAPKVLVDLGVGLDGLRAAVEERVPPGPEPADDQPFTPRAKKVMELALRQALELGHNYIGTEHLLLGVIAEPEGIGGQILREQGVSVESAKAKVVEHLARLTSGK